MILEFLENEKIYGDFPYRRTTRKEHKEDVVVSESELFITNKRIVLAERKNNDISRKEVLIDNIVGVQSSFSYKEGKAENHRIQAWALIIGSILVTIALSIIYAAIVKDLLETFAIIFGLLLAVIIIACIVLIVSNIRVLKQPKDVDKYCQVTFDIYTDREFYSCVSDNTSAYHKAEIVKPLFKTKTTNSKPIFQVVVDVLPVEANKLVSEVGSAIIKAKEDK